MKAQVLLIFCIVLTTLGCDEQADDKSIWWTDEDRQLILNELQRTTDELLTELSGLTEIQWNFRESNDRWNIGEIIEHLEMQNQLHYREISVTSKAPQYLKFRAVTKGQDEYFTKYATDATPGEAQWFLEPLGRFRTKAEGENAFLRARGHLQEFVAETKVDLRKQFTFRVEVEDKSVDELSIGQVRDLHQLLLTGIAHTDRHLRQIRAIKTHNNYPK